jgi:CBS domain-containing protein
MTPLVSIDAVAIDTETTGLDPRIARVVEVAALRIRQGRVDASDSLHALVRPDIPIPAAATAIHGIDDSKVATCPPFVDVWKEFSAIVDESIVIGHSIGFDLAVLREECRRIGIDWKTPAGLDTRLLAQIVHGRLADYSIEHLAGWLGVEIVHRHTALGDASTAARIFEKLVPLLRERGIRTVSQATQACRALTDTIDKHDRAGWVNVTDDARDIAFDDAGPRIDIYPYRHRVRDIMSAPAKFITAQIPLRDALKQMVDARISSLFVSEKTGPVRAKEAGIVTERDLLRSLAAHNEVAFQHQVGDVMSSPLVVVSADAFAYVAIGRMSRLGVRHLGVVDETEHVVGALSARDLLQLRAEGALLLGDGIGQATNAAGLAQCWAQLPTVAAALRVEGITGLEVAQIVSRQIGAMTRRAAVIAEDWMKQSGYGPAPTLYAVAVLGSGGRGESLLAADQDNALIFSDGEPGGPEDRWFATLGEHIARILNEAGLPYCKGGVMAKNPDWRGDVSTWRKRIGLWVDRSKPLDLLNVDIFFDLRGVHGDIQMADSQWRHAFDVAKGRADFAKLLVESTGPTPPAVGWFGRLRTDRGRIDLKKAGLFGIVGAARALAICHHVVERSTPARLNGLKARGLAMQADLDTLKETHATFIGFILDQQLDDVRNGFVPGNSVAVARLSSRDRERLRNALDSVGHLDELVRTLLFAS